MLKVGRYTAAILLVTVGVMLLLDQTTGSHYLALLLDWWPVLLILLGCEYLLFNFIYYKTERQLRLDMGGLVISVLVSAAVLGTTQSDRLPTEWLKNLDFSISTLNLSFSTESGHRFEKEPITIAVPEAAGKIVVDNPNGSVTIQGEEVDEIKIETTVWVDKVDEDTARGIAEKSAVRVSGDSQLEIKADGEEYTGGFPNKRKPRMNLIITVPKSHKADYVLELRNGKVDAAQVPVMEEFKARTINGAVSIRDIQGKVSAETTNGAVEVSQISGSTTVNTTNGTVKAQQIWGKLQIDTTNGGVNVEQVEGPLEVDTLNGAITIREAAAGIKADATNGAISVHTTTVGGDYELDNVTSSIELKIPETADVRIKGSTSYGSISTNLPLEVDGKKLTGVLGTGLYTIELNTNNKIQVNKID